MQRDAHGLWVAGDWEPRFWSYVNKTDSCWLWTGPTMHRGYGRFHYAGRYRRAHRFAYQQLVGPIEAQTLDHLCRNRLCVNPAHLEPVSVRENTLRGNTITARAAAATHCPQGHPYDETNTYRWKGKPHSRQCRSCNRTRALARRAAR